MGHPYRMVLYARLTERQLNRQTARLTERQLNCQTARLAGWFHTSALPTVRPACLTDSLT